MMSGETLALDQNFMFRTAYPEIYEELCQNRKLFKLEIHLFASALAMGVLSDAKSEKKPVHDIIRLSQLSRDEHQEVKDVINIISQLVYVGPDKRARGENIIAYADGGIDLLWQDVKTQGVLDIPRILDETKRKWPKRIIELLNTLEQKDQ